MELVAKVSDIFHINGRGMVLALEFPSKTANIAIGDQIELKSPGGSFTEAKIGVISHLNRGSRTRGGWGIMLAPPLNEEEFERGTEIWLVSRPEKLPKG